MKIGYYPILKWKKGEQIALQHIRQNDGLVPVIEIIDDCKPFDFFTNLKSFYQGEIYYDTYRCDDERRSLLLEFIAYCNDNSIQCWPLVYYNDINIFDNVAASTSQFAVKLPIPEDFEGPTNEEVIKNLHLYTESNQVDLFLDAGPVTSSTDASRAVSDYSSMLTKFSDDLKDFRKIIICITSFPTELNINSGESDQYRRFDFAIFKRISQKFKKSVLIENLAYSDYGVTKFTDSELDFRLLKYGILPKIKYTTNDFYYISKGQKNRATGEFTVSYNDLALQIVNSPFYYGKDFSFGDAAIYDKASNLNSKPGNSTNWVSYCANHHIAVVVEQLSSLYDFLEHPLHNR